MVQLTDNARRIFDLRYSRKDEDGNPTETPEQAVRRVAQNVASVTALYPRVSDTQDEASGSMSFSDFPFVTAQRQWHYFNQQGKFPSQHHGKTFGEVMRSGFHRMMEQAERYEDMISRLDFLPNSPTWTGAGTPLGQLAACFVLPVEDDLVSGRGSIFDTLRNAVAIQQTGGGNGFSFGRLRPNGDLVKRSMGKASGPMGFARAYDSAFEEIAQGGTRRGANMLVLPVSHPDIREFINSKTVEGDLSQFNISVAITDEFMEAVEKEGEFDLVHGGKVYETVQARELYDEIVENAWVIGDPGNLFIDRANQDNPVPTRYRLEATNPCGEQWLGPYENCCLGSIAVSNFASWDGTFDWERFRETVVTATEFLDDVIDANQYVSAVPELETAAQGGRRIGLGLMGLADAMLILGIRYGSAEALHFASDVTEFARYHSMFTSIERAKERGPFEWITDSIYDPFLHREFGPGAEVKLDNADGEWVTFNLWSRPTEIMDEELAPVPSWITEKPDWSEVEKGIAAHGIRNSCQFTFAPTGTISNVAGLEGSGCEPLFALTYTRKVMQDGQNISLSYASPLFQTALEQAGVAADRIETIVSLVAANGGSCQGIDEVPPEIREVFVVAADVTPSDHIWTQATLQRFVDNSISKTINLPNEATVEDVNEAYRLAYELGCKGITVYRQGSRMVEVLTTGTEKPVDEWLTVHPKKIPHYAADRGLAGRVFPIESAFGKIQATITELEAHPGRPFDIRLQVGKAGSDKGADVEAIGRMISLSLRSGVAVADIVDQLEGIGGQSFHGFGDRRVKSVADGVAKLLARHYLDYQEMEAMTDRSVTVTSVPLLVDTSQVCPECHNTTLVMEAGCRHCDIRLGGCGQFTGCD